jgi:hypothetical protein
MEVASLHIDAAVASAASAGESAGGSSSSERSPSSVQTAAARMRFSVSVPVLSVQMTVVEPSVSTAERRTRS